MSTITESCAKQIRQHRRVPLTHKVRCPGSLVFPDSRTAMQDQHAGALTLSSNQPRAKPCFILKLIHTRKSLQYSK